MQKKRFSTKVFSVVLSLLMMLTVIPLVPFTSTADAAYANEYYYPAGTKYIKDIAMVYYKSASEGQASLGNAVGAGAGNGYVLAKDLTAGTGSSYYVYVGWTWTTNPAEAVRGFRIEHNGSLASSYSQSGVMWYPVNSGVHSWVPQLHGDGCVDLNKGKSDSDDLKLYVTKDPAFGDPVTFLDRAGSTGERDNLLNAGYKGVVTFSDNSYIIDINKGAGGDDLFFLYQTSPLTKVNTASLRSAYTDTASYIGVEGYTAASIGELADARNAAKTIMDAFDNNSGYATYTQSEINAVTNRINNAVNNLKITLKLNGTVNGGDKDQTVEITVGKNKTAQVDLSKYTASKTGATFAGWAKSALATEGTTGTVTVGFNETYYALFGVELTANFHYLQADGTLKTETKKFYAMNAANAASTPKPNIKNAKINGREFEVLGWRLDTTAAEATITKSGIYTVYTSDPVVDLYAVYSADITFTQDVNRGEPAIETEVQTQYLNASEGLPRTSHTFTVTDTAPEREGGTFLGWADNTTAQSAQYTAGYQFTVTDNLTIYAAYKMNYVDIVFVNDNGDVLDEQSIAYGDDAFYPEITPEKDYDDTNHYAFVGWDYTAEQLLAVKTDLTVTAQYDAIAHIIKDEFIAEPDCTTAGLKNQYCTDCAFRIDNIAIDALGHIEVVQAAQEATCTMAGISEKITCQRCQALLQAAETTPALGHTYSDVPYFAVAATCATGGYSEYKCLNCSFIKKGDVTPPTGEHIPQILKAEAATCTTNGLTEGSECMQCGAVIVPQQTVFGGHSIVTIPAVKPTCTETGLTAGEYCEIEGCDYKVEQTVVPALGHEWREVSGLAATCTTAGYTASTICVNCNATEGKEVIPALEHDYVATVTEPTCTAKGYTTYVCANDAKHTYVDDYTSVIPHTGGTATCSAYAVCSTCGQKYGKLAAHNYVAVVTAPTCTEKGYTTYTCSECNDSYVANRTNTIAHEYNDGVVTTAPTCTEAGVKTFTCLNCPETYTAEVAATGHNITWELVDGIACGTCANCNEQFEADPEDVGIEIEVPDCEKCGSKHTDTSGLFKEDGLFCKIIAFFRSIVNFFKSK